MPTENKAWEQSKLRSSKYLNNLIEQDHRGIKFRTRPMLGFKNYDCAATTIAGIELLHRIGKNQFSLRPLSVKDQTAPTIWNASARRMNPGRPRGPAIPASIFAPEPNLSGSWQYL